LTKRADNALLSTRRAHFAVVSICAVAIITSILQPNSNYARVLEEAEFLVGLGAPEEPNQAPFLESYAAERSLLVVPKDIAELLSFGEFDVEWEEPRQLRVLKEQLSSASGYDGDRGGQRDLWTHLSTFGEGHSYNLFSFSDEPSYTNAECGLVANFEMYLVRHPQAGTDGFDDTYGNMNFAQAQEILERPKAHALGRIASAWNFLETVYIWYPVATRNEGILVVKDPINSLQQVSLPARLVNGRMRQGEEVGNRCNTAAFELSNQHLGWYRIGVDARSVDVSNGQIVEGLFEISGSFEYRSGYYQEPDFADFYASADEGRRLTAVNSVDIPMDARVEVTGGWKILLADRSILDLPEWMTLDRFDVAFPTLSKYMAEYTFMDSDGLESVISRLEEATDSEARARPVKILGFEVPPNEIGMIGLVSLLLAQFYLFIHLRNLRNELAYELTDETWIGAIDDPIARFASFGSIIVLPIATALWLVRVSHIQDSPAGGIRYYLLLALGASAFLFLHHLLARTLLSLHKLQGAKGVP
jgi:hypothetical protein